MKKEKEFIVSVNVNIAASIIVKGDDEFQALQSLIESINSHNIVISEQFDLETTDGEIHTFDTHDLELDYQDVEETVRNVCKVNKKKNTA